MSFLLKDQWRSWAAEWGLTHVPEKGWLRRTERVLGPRKDLLFRVSWGKDDDPGLNVTIRFPRTLDPQGLREALIANAALDVLPGKGAARRKMAVETGPKKTVRIGSRPEFLLNEDRLVWRRTFAFHVPKPAQIQAWVDALVEAIGRATPRFGGDCETCATGRVSGYVVVDEYPMMMCATCQQRLRTEGEMANRAYEMTEARHLNGAALGAIGMVLGAIAWAGIGALTHRMFAVAAIGIGVMVAFGYRFGAGRVDVTGRVIAAALTVGSVVLGEIVLLAWWIAERFPNIGFDLDAGWLAYQKTWAVSPAEEAIPLFFGLVGAWVASQALQKPRLAATIQQAGSPQGQHDKAA